MVQLKILFVGWCKVKLVTDENFETMLHETMCTLSAFIHCYMTIQIYVSDRVQWIMGYDGRKKNIYENSIPMVKIKLAYRISE